MEIKSVITARPASGDAQTLQPASPLSDNLRSELFDEFAQTAPPLATTAGIPWLPAVLLAATLAVVAVYILRHVQPHE